MVRDVAVDTDGNVYVTGSTSSADFPVTSGAFSTELNSGEDTGLEDAFVAKIDPDGNILWATYLGGPGDERGYGLEVDGSGRVHVAGRAGAGFPVTSGAFQTQFMGGSGQPEYDGFVCRLSADGSTRDFCSYLGTSDQGAIRDVDIDGQGDIYVASFAESGSFPSEWFTGAFQPSRTGGQDGLVAKISSDGSTVLWATYLGGSGDEGSGPSVRVDDSGQPVFLGGTRSADIPTPGGFSGSPGGGLDMYLMKVNSDGSELVFGSYLGGSDDEGPETHNLALGPSDEILVATFSFSADYPTTEGVVQDAPASSDSPADAVITRTAADGGRIVASTYLGGNGFDGAQGVDVDPGGRVFLSGGTGSDDFPSTHELGPGGEADAVVVVLTDDLTSVVAALRIGGTGADEGRAIAVDGNGGLAVGGQTRSSDWPVEGTGSGPSGGLDGIVVRLVPPDS